MSLVLVDFLSITLFAERGNKIQLLFMSASPYRVWTNKDNFSLRGHGFGNHSAALYPYVTQVCEVCPRNYCKFYSSSFFAMRANPINRGTCNDESV